MIIVSGYLNFFIQFKPRAIQLIGLILFNQFYSDLSQFSLKCIDPVGFLNF